MPVAVLLLPLPQLQPAEYSAERLEMTKWMGIQTLLPKHWSSVALTGHSGGVVRLCPAHDPCWYAVCEVGLAPLAGVQLNQTLHGNAADFPQV